MKKDNQKDINNFDENSLDENNDFQYIDGESKKAGKIFSAFTIKDIVFMAIMTAAMFASSAVMPLVAKIPIFGLPQLVTAFQMSFFITLTVYKIRKVGVIFFMLLLMGAVLAAMSVMMLINNLIVGVLLELVVILIFRGYKKNIQIIIVGCLYPILSTPIQLVYLLLLKAGNKTSASYYYDPIKRIAENPGATSGVLVAILVVSILASILAVLLSKELEKAKVLKNNG